MGIFLFPLHRFLLFFIVLRSDFFSHFQNREYPIVRIYSEDYSSVYIAKIIVLEKYLLNQTPWSLYQICFFFFNDNFSYFIIVEISSKLWLGVDLYFYLHFFPQSMASFGQQFSEYDIIRGCRNLCAHGQRLQRKFPRREGKKR